MDIFDVVDEHDNVIGKATVKECHSNLNLIHRALHFTLLDRKRNLILLTQRSFDVKFDSGLWCFAGEHVKSGETWEQAVVRGVREEMGIVASSWKEIGNHIFSYNKQTEFVRCFLIDCEEQLLQFDSKEIIDCRWVSWEELVKEKSQYSEMTRFWIAQMGDIVRYGGFPLSWE